MAKLLTSVWRSATFLLALVTVTASLALPNNVAAAEHLPLMISTQKALGPVPGTFSTSGAFADYGTLITEQRTTSALPSPFGVVTHLVLLFEGQQGTFTLRTQIIETVTNDPNIFADDGVWVIISGTGLYANLRGTGKIDGTVNDATNLITRIYTGIVQFP